MDGRYGASFGNSESESSINKRQLVNMKKYDEMQTELIVDSVFELYPEGMYFDEFIEFAEEVSCEFVYCIYDSFYHFIPCVQNFLVMRANYV